MLRYRCPLCLAPLTEKDELTRFCWTHPARAERFRPVQAPEKLLCPGTGGERCAANDGVRPPAVYLRHSACGGADEPRNHPYWKGRHAEYLLPNPAEVETPNPEELVAEDEQGAKARVDHWEIELLRAIERASSAFEVLRGPEMWFPALLLRGTADTAPLEGKRLASLVELCGRTKVGKTVLAMQALDYDGYVSNAGNGRDPAHVALEAFLYMPWPLRTEGSEAVKGFHQALKLHSLMARDEPVTGWFLPTPHVPGNLRAVFLRPAQARKGEKARRSGALRGALRLLGEAARELGGFSSDGSQTGPGWWWTVAFYDTAGEASDRDLDGVLTGLEAAVDVVAVLLAADDLTGGNGGSFGVARRRLEALANRVGAEARPRCCLVMTKVDLLFGEARRKSEVLAAMEGGGTASQQLLLEWLRGSANPESRKLAALLASPSSPVDRVFLVFTEGLDGPRPVSSGIATFVCWCLGIEPERIDLGRAAAEA